MSSKQDVVAARTATDIERKYNFGKKFSEILDLVDDSRDKVDSVESSLRNEIKETATTLSRNTEEIVTKATADVKTELTENISDVEDDVESLSKTVTEVSKEVELKLNTDAFTVAVGEMEKEYTESIKSVEESVSDVEDSVEGLSKTVTEVSKQVELKVDADGVNIAVEKRIAQGVDRVYTATGYRFDSDGLNISKGGEEMTNLLDNTGMYVKRSGENILAANNEGVEAFNLHAKTYLIIGSGEGRSRIEDYKTDRTGVFWIG